jgi:tripartite-type tricarboxylate transporter receptor subunit TctC
LVVVDDPGSRDGIYARQMQQALRGISPVEVVVSDEPSSSWGLWVKLKEMPSRNGGKDGYYPIVVNVYASCTDPLVEPITEKLELDLSDMNMIVVTEKLPYTVVQKKNAPWGRKFSDMIAWAKANPGKLRRPTDGIGTAQDINALMAFKQLGVKDFRIPQPSTGAALAALGAGEGDVMFISIGAAMPHIEAGKMDLTMIIGSKVPPPWDKDPNVTTTDAAGLGFMSKIGVIEGFCTVKDTPKSHIEWLAKLFKAGAGTALYKSREKTVPGWEPILLSSEEANAIKDSFAKLADPIIRDLGMHVDQKKK